MFKVVTRSGKCLQAVTRTLLMPIDRVNHTTLMNENFIKKGVIDAHSAMKRAKSSHIILS
jgi:hypothetical protein